MGIFMNSGKNFLKMTLKSLSYMTMKTNHGKSIIDYLKI